MLNYAAHKVRNLNVKPFFCYIMRLQLGKTVFQIFSQTLISPLQSSRKVLQNTKCFSGRNLEMPLNKDLICIYIVEKKTNKQTMNKLMSYSVNCMLRSLCKTLLYSQVLKYFQFACRSIELLNIIVKHDYISQWVLVGVYHHPRSRLSATWLINNNN